MARKNVFTYSMLDGADLSGNITSPSTNVINVDSASIHLVWSGTAPVGVVTVQAKNSINDSWYDVDMGGTINISGASGDHQLIFNSLPFYEIRLQYARSSGSGSIDAVLVAKQVGG